MEVFEDGFHFFDVIKAVIDKKLQFGYDPCLLADPPAQLKTDLRLVLTQSLEDVLRFGSLEYTHVNTGKSQVGSHFHVGDCQELRPVPIHTLTLKKLPELLLDESGVFLLSDGIHAAKIGLCQAPVPVPYLNDCFRVEVVYWYLVPEPVEGLCR